MKTKKVLPLISLLFVTIMLFSIGMIVKEHRKRQEDIKGFEKLIDLGIRRNTAVSCVDITTTLNANSLLIPV